MERGNDGGRKEKEMLRRENGRKLYSWQRRQVGRK